jgi:hypothetical protein
MINKQWPQQSTLELILGVVLAVCVVSEGFGKLGKKNIFFGPLESFLNTIIFIRPEKW